MLGEIENIEKQALRLSKKDRGLLAERLLLSIDESSLTDIDEAWIREAERRYDDYVSGRAAGIPGEGVISGIRKELGWKG